MYDHASGETFEDLDFYGGEYEAKNAFTPDLDTLPNGDYDFEILSAALERTKTNDRLVRLELRTAAGRTVRHTWWLNKQEAVNRLGADLVVLGFDADKWGNATGRPLSKELPLAVSRLKGLKFRATKTSREDSRPDKKGTFYHDLYISCRLDGRPMPPLSPPVQTAPRTPAPSGAANGSGGSTDIPF